MLAAKNEYFIFLVVWQQFRWRSLVEGVAKSLNNLTSPLCAICDATDARCFGGRSLVTTSCTPPHQFHLDCVAETLLEQCLSHHGERLCTVCAQPPVLPLHRASNTLAVDACLHGDLQALKIALKLDPVIAEEEVCPDTSRRLYGIDSNTRVSLIFIAARQGHADCVRLLMANACDKFLKKAFYAAADKGHIRVMDCLIDKLQATGKDNLQTILDNALGMSASTEQHKSVKYLLEKGASSLDGALCQAASFGRLESIRLLISFGADTINSLNPGMMAAISTDHPEAMEVFLETGTSPLDTSLLCCALWSDSPACLKRLIEMGLSIKDIPRNNPLLVLQSGSIWQSYASSGLLVIRKDHFIEALSSLGASVGQGESTLHIATQLEATGCLPILISNGVDINTVDDKGFSALHWGALTGNTLCAEMLILAGADINAKNHRGDTALHLAARLGKFEYLTILVASGAGVNATNKRGKTPIDFASDNDCYTQLLNSGSLHGGQLLQKAREAGQTAEGADTGAGSVNLCSIL